MTRKIILGVAVFIGFLIACAGVATMQMVIGGLMPNNQPDQDGKLDPDPQVQAKQEWEAKLKEDGQTQTQTKEEPVQQTQQPTPTVVEEPVVLQPAPPPPPPRAPSTGPGNIDAAPAYYSAPAPTGPGNM